MLRHSLPLLLVALLVSSAVAQPALYRVDLEDRIDGAGTIVEGRVLSQRSFWNEAGTMINTASRINVYRVFKGDSSLQEVELVTAGGVMGLSAMRVDPSLRVSPNEVGVFFLEETSGEFLPYASVQGFVRYDEVRGRAEDAFESYANIKQDLYRPIELRLARAATVVTAFELTGPPVQSKSGRVPAISSLSPGSISAGTGSELVITGTGFEANTAQALIAFANANVGQTGGSFLVAPATDIISWTDTQIRLRVPTGAGTGNVVVQTQGQLQAQSPSPLTVTFNHVTLATGNATGLLPDLRSKNAEGGYSFAFSTSTASGGVDFSTSPAVAPFNRALQTWRTGTGYNAFANGAATTSNSVDPQVEPDIVMFDNDANPLPVGLLGRATSGYSSCNGTNWWVQGVDIVFRRNGTDNLMWNFGPRSSPFAMFDFESVAVHELGHAHQLGHVIDPSSVMHFTITNGTDLRTLNPVSEIDGGQFVVSHSVLLNACGQRGMTPLFSVDVEQDELPDGFRVSSVYPNPFSTKATIRVTAPSPQTVQVTAFDLLGRQVANIFSGHIGAAQETILIVDGRQLPSGMYVVVIQGSNFRATRRLLRV